MTTTPALYTPTLGATHSEPLYEEEAPRIKKYMVDAGMPEADAQAELRVLYLTMPRCVRDFPPTLREAVVLEAATRAVIAYARLTLEC